jgi:hypothetical protein
MKAYGGGVILAPLIINGALGFDEWSVECIKFSTLGEKSAGTFKISWPCLESNMFYSSRRSRNTD